MLTYVSPSVSLRARGNYQMISVGSRIAFACCALAIIQSPGAALAQNAEYVAPVQVEQTDEKSLKRKVAIARFTNVTRYGQTLLRDSNLDPLGKQAADILSAYLVQSGAFNPRFCAASSIAAAR